MTAAADRLAALAGRLGALLAALLAWAEGAPWRGPVLAGLVAAAVALPGISALPVTDRDEGRFVQATKQMLETGDLVDIRFQEQPRWKKPIGIYWLQAGTASLFGGTEAPIWAYRIPSALAVVLAAMLTAWAARPLVPPAAAALAGMALATTVLAAGEANIAKTDATLLLTATVAFGALVRAATGTAGRWTWLAFWLAMAAAALVKGPVVPVIALLALAALWIVRRRPPGIAALRPIPGLVLAIALVAPWLSAIWVVSEGQFFAEAVGRDLLGKVAEGQEAHWGPPGLYLVLVWVTFWPWAAFLPGALAEAWANRRTETVLVLAAWVLPFWIVLEAVPTKLPHYVLPLYPALAILVAAWLLRAAPPPDGWKRRAAAWLAAVPGAGLGLAAFLLPLAVERTLVPGALVLGLAGAVLALAAGVAARRGRLIPQAAASLAAALAVYPAVLQFGLPAMATAFPSPHLAALAAPWQPCASRPLVSLGYREPSLVFLTDTRTALISPAETAALLAADPGTLALIEERHMAQLREALGPLAAELVERGRLSYFNPNRGKPATAVLLTRDHPRWTPCGG